MWNVCRLIARPVSLRATAHACGVVRRGQHLARRRREHRRAGPAEPRRGERRRRPGGRAPAGSPSGMSTPTAAQSARRREHRGRVRLHRPLDQPRRHDGDHPATGHPIHARDTAGSCAVRVYIGSDHAGFELKAHLLAHLASLGHDVVDVGPATYDAEDDYPPLLHRHRPRGARRAGHASASSSAARATASRSPPTRCPASGPRWRGTSRPRSWPGSTTTPRSSPSGRACTRSDEAAELAAAFVADAVLSEDPRHQRRIDEPGEVREDPRAARAAAGCLMPDAGGPHAAPAGPAAPHAGSRASRWR